MFKVDGGRLVRALAMERMRLCDFGPIYGGSSGVGGDEDLCLRVYSRFYVFV